VSPHQIGRRSLIVAQEDANPKGGEAGLRLNQFDRRIGLPRPAYFSNRTGQGHMIDI
jgi:hypothetical protein